VHHRDEILVALCLEGDSRAWEKLLTQLRDLACKGLRGRAQWTERDIEDVVQQTCELLMKTDCRLLRQYEPNRARLRTYLGGILTNVALRYARTHFGREQLWPDPPEPPNSTWGEINVEAITLWHVAERVLSSEDLAILRFSNQGYRSAEIADILSRIRQRPITPAAVRKRKERALQRIRRQLGAKSVLSVSQNP